MNNIKCFLLRLYLLIYSPLFPILTCWIIFIAYRIYFEPAILCDDHGFRLFQLKSEVTAETANYRVAVVQCEQYNDLKYQIQAFKQNDPGYRNPEGEKVLAENIRTWENNKAKALINVRRLEAMIRPLDARFQSAIQSCGYYPRIGRGY